MSNTKLNFDFSFIKISFWLTVFLGILKISNAINISTLWVFLPVIISAAFVFLIVFGIGCMVVYYIATHLDEIEKELNKNNDNDDTETSEIKE